MNIKQMMQGISDIYNEQWRAYHNWNHVQRMLTDYFTYFGDSCESAGECDRMNREMYWAIIFHDIICDPGKRDNEERSATMAWHLLSNSVLKDRVWSDRVRLLIMATKHPSYRSLDHEKEMIADLDLAGLADDKEDFLESGEKIRQEYSSYSKEDFFEGRIAFWNLLLAQDHIYKTKEMRQLLEDKARENLNNDIKFMEEKLNA